jgi:hypothetical protein
VRKRGNSLREGKRGKRKGGGVEVVGDEESIERVRR